VRFARQISDKALDESSVEPFHPATGLFRTYRYEDRFVFKWVKIRVSFREHGRL
jgi:hypothetical protein